MLNINIDGKKMSVANDTTYHALALSYEKENAKMPFLVKVDGIIKELRRSVKQGETIEFLYYDNDVVKESYARTAIFMMLKAFYDLYGAKNEARLKFKIHNAYYFELEGKKLTENDVHNVGEAFNKIVEDDFYIEKLTFPKKKAFEIFEEKKMEDARLLFQYQYKPLINLRNINGYIRYINGELLYSTGYIKHYELEFYHEGLLLILPNGDDVTKVDYSYTAEKLFNVHNVSVDWAKKLRINTVGKLNDEIARNHLNDLVVMTESFQDKQIGDIASCIQKSKKQLILISGPSSSGKTTFSHRLMYHIKALELNPHPISCDDFFKERVETPKKPNGEYDFESLRAVDVKLLNDTLNGLLKGEEVVIPKFDFVLGKKDFTQKKLKINKNDIIILEGIHCLNPKLTKDVNVNNIFKVYISALTEVCIDYANRIPTSDLRLIRRIVRDKRTRGTDAKTTLKRWKEIREGEEKYIFPFQEQADIFFNSALIYEFSALKHKALPMLYNLSEDEEVGVIAKRLIKTLNYFLNIDTELIPRYSLVREFIGGSSLDVG